MKTLARIALILGLGVLVVGAQLVLADWMAHPAPPANYRCVADGRCLQVPAGAEEIVFSDAETIVVPRRPPALAQR